MIRQLNVSMSGIGDRILDILLVSTLAKIKNTNLISIWKNPLIENDEYSVLRPTFRLYDCLYENMIKYINFPSNVTVLPENNNIIIDNNNDFLFDTYLGGSYSPFTFYDKFIKNNYNITINDYLLIYFEQSKQLTFNIVSNNIIPPDIITIHLRRTDKVCNQTGTHNISYNELDQLNNKTHRIIDKLIQDGYTSFYFCGDDSSVVQNYVSHYEKIINIITYDYDKDNIMKTYLDLYVISLSNIIVLSQRHSNFSLLGSLINKNKLIYLYDDDMIHNLYKGLDHLIYFNDFFDSLDSD